MRTTLALDEKLVKEAMKCSGAKSKTAAVNRALEEFVRQRKLQGLLEVAGKIRMEDNWRELEEQELRAMKADERRRRGRR